MCLVTVGLCKLLYCEISQSPEEMKPPVMNLPEWDIERCVL